MKKYEKKNVSIKEWCSNLNFEPSDRKHVEYHVPVTKSGSNLSVGEPAYKPTALDEDLDRLARAGARLLGFKRLGDQYVVRTMVPR